MFSYSDFLQDIQSPFTMHSTTTTLNHVLIISGVNLIHEVLQYNTKNILQNSLRMRIACLTLYYTNQI